MFGKFISILLLIFTLCSAWDSPVILRSSLWGHDTYSILSMYMDPDTLITHGITKLGTNYAYMQLDAKKRVLVARDISPRDLFYNIGHACLANDGGNLTIVSSVYYSQDQTSEIWYMNSFDHGHTWTEYKKVPTKPSKDRIVRDVWCPLINIKETKQLVVIYHIQNMSSPTRSMMLGMTTKPSNSEDFTQEKIVVAYPMYREGYSASAAYSMKDGKPILHVVTIGNFSLIYIRSENFGATWTKPVILSNQASIDQLSTHLLSLGGSDLMVSYETSYGKPIEMKVSRDNGASWSKGSPLSDKYTSGAYSAKICREGGLYVLIGCPSGGVCLYLWDIRTLTRKQLPSPFEKQGSDGYLECAHSTENGADWMVAFDNIHDDEHVYFEVSHDKTGQL